jgi:hypothetical protein
MGIGIAARTTVDQKRSGREVSALISSYQTYTLARHCAKMHVLIPKVRHNGQPRLSPLVRDKQTVRQGRQKRRVSQTSDAHGRILEDGGASPKRGHRPLPG